jgi:hypothetical protein
MIAQLRGGLMTIIRVGGLDERGPSENGETAAETYLLLAHRLGRHSSLSTT